MRGRPRKYTWQREVGKVLWGQSRMTKHEIEDLCGLPRDTLQKFDLPEAPHRRDGAPPADPCAGLRLELEKKEKELEGLREHIQRLELKLLSEGVDPLSPDALLEQCKREIPRVIKDADGAKLSAVIRALIALKGPVAADDEIAFMREIAAPRIGQTFRPEEDSEDSN